MPVLFCFHQIKEDDMRRFQTVMFKVIDILAILTMVLGAPMSVAAAPQAEGEVPVLVLDKADYAPGESAYINGAGFVPDDYVLAVMGPAGTAITQWETVTTDGAGGFAFVSPALEAGAYEVRAYTAPWSGDWNESAAAAVSLSVTEPVQEPTPEPTVEPTQEPTVEPTATTEPIPTPTLTTDKVDYSRKKL